MIVLNFMSYIHEVRRVATVCILRLVQDDLHNAVKLIRDKKVYPHLLNNIQDGDEQVVDVTTQAITSLVMHFDGLARLRFLTLMGRLFIISRFMALKVYQSGLLSLFSRAMYDSNGYQEKLGVLQILHEMAQVEYSIEFCKVLLSDLLPIIISKRDGESNLRSWAMMIVGRLLSKENVFDFIDDNAVETVALVISVACESMESPFEWECALRALGEIGASSRGATILMSGVTLTGHVRPAFGLHLVTAAFSRQQCAYWQVSLHSLANIVGETRSENDVLLHKEAEGNLERLIREQTSKINMTFSDFILSLLQRDDARIAGFRLISGLIARSWCLIEILSKPEIIELVTAFETNELEMQEAKLRCCERVLTVIKSSLQVNINPVYSVIVPKLEEAINVARLEI